MPSPIEPKVRGLKAMLTKMVSQVPSGDHNGWRNLLSQIDSMTRGAEALHVLAITRNPTVTDAAHVKQLATAAERYGKNVKDALDYANKTLQDESALITARIKAKVNLNPSSYGKEIRNAFRAMNDKERVDVLNEMVDSNRGPDLAALLKAPRLLTRLTDDQIEKYEKAIIAKNAPEELVAQDVLMEGFNSFLIARDTALEVARAYNDPEMLATVAKAESAADAAAKQFNLSVGAA